MQLKQPPTSHHFGPAPDLAHHTTYCTLQIPPSQDERSVPCPHWEFQAFPRERAKHAKRQTLHAKPTLDLQHVSRPCNTYRLDTLIHRRRRTYDELTSVYKGRTSDRVEHADTHTQTQMQTQASWLIITPPLLEKLRTTRQDADH